MSFDLCDQKLQPFICRIPLNCRHWNKDNVNQKNPGIFFQCQSIEFEIFITSVQEYIRADGVCSGCSLSFKVDIMLIVYSWTRIDGTQGCCNPSSLGPCYLWRKDFQWNRVPGQDRRLLYSQCVILSLNLAWPKKKCISKNINSENGEAKFSVKK